MDREIENMKEIINKARIKGESELIANREYLQRIVNYVETLRRENKRLRETVDRIPSNIKNMVMENGKNR